MGASHPTHNKSQLLEFYSQVDIVDPTGRGVLTCSIALKLKFLSLAHKLLFDLIPAYLSSFISHHPSTSMLCFSQVEFLEQFLEFVILFPFSVPLHMTYFFSKRALVSPQFPSYRLLLTSKVVPVSHFPESPSLI